MQRGQTDTEMAVTSIHFASTTPHAKCNNNKKGNDCSDSIEEGLLSVHNEAFC